MHIYLCIYPYMYDTYKYIYMYMYVCISNAWIYVYMSMVVYGMRFLHAQLVVLGDIKGDDEVIMLFMAAICFAGKLSNCNFCVAYVRFRLLRCGLTEIYLFVVAAAMLAVTSSNCFPQAQSDPVLGTNNLVQPLPWFAQAKDIVKVASVGSRW